MRERNEKPNNILHSREIFFTESSSTKFISRDDFIKWEVTSTFQFPPTSTANRPSFLPETIQVKYSKEFVRQCLLH